MSTFQSWWTWCWFLATSSWELCCFQPGRAQRAGTSPLPSTSVSSPWPPLDSETWSPTNLSWQQANEVDSWITWRYYECFVVEEYIFIIKSYGNENATNSIHERASFQMMFVILYCIFGMTLISMCINLMSEQLTGKAKWVATELGMGGGPEPGLNTNSIFASTHFLEKSLLCLEGKQWPISSGETRVCF